MNWTLVTATNSEQVLKTCLLSSPCASTASEVLLQKGYTDAAAAYNAAIDQATTDLLVFAHQDLYLPDGWIEAVQKSIDLLSAQGTTWGVLGVWGGTKPGNLPGYMYWTGVDGVAGRPFEGVLEVSTLDEVVLILRKSSGLRFDEQIPGFHFYGTDICLEAKRRGMKCYAINAFCVHNTNGYNLLPMDYWKNFFRIRKKWKLELPITSPCIEVTQWCWPMLRWNIVQTFNFLVRRRRAAKRVSDPARVYRELIASGTISPPAPTGGARQFNEQAV